MKLIIKCLKQYADFKGTAGRQEFAYFISFSILLQILFLAIDIYFGLGMPNIVKGILWYPLFEISRLVLLLPSLGVTVRRLNDVNRSGWWVLLVFTLIGIIPLFYWCLFKEGKLDKN